MDLTTCPDCGALSEVLDRFVLESTDGPVDHARIRCVRGHWFLLPVEALARAVAPPTVHRRDRPTPIRRITGR